MKTFVEELKRRNVLRAAAIYAGAAWLLVQIATQVFPFFDIPNWAVRLVVVAALIGLPIVLLVSWFYEFTPEGLKRESEVDHSGDAARRRARAIDRRVLIPLGIVAALLITDLALHQHLRPDASARPSVAVLPFKNLSSDPENSYFTDGIQDEILTRLAKIGALKVISRTSTAHYASEPANLPDIARDLGVDNIVEGSVQRSADSARINVQLIAAHSDTHLWAESYERKLTNVFDVESEVAKAIADSLQAKLTGTEKQELAAAPTDNPKAYDAYLRGLAFDLRSFEPVNLANAATWLGKAVNLDPGFALAWARLARVESNRFYQGFDPSAQPCKRAHHAAEAATRLQPELGEGDLAQGYVHFMCDADLKGAEQFFLKARTRLPNDAEVLDAIAKVERHQGNWEASLQHMKEAEQLDPRNPALLGSQALSFGLTRRFAEARAVADRALEISPDDTAMTAFEALTYQASGDLDAAQKLLDGLALQPTAADVFEYQMLQLLYRGRYADAIPPLKAALAEDLSSVGANAADYYYLLATAERATGDAESARRSFGEGHDFLSRYASDTTADASAAGIYLRSLLCIMDIGRGTAEDKAEDCKRTRIVAASDSEFAVPAQDALARAEALAGNQDAALDLIAGLLGKSYFSMRYTVPLTPALLRQDPVWLPLKDIPRFRTFAAIPVGR